MQTVASLFTTAISIIIRPSPMWKTEETCTGKIMIMSLKTKETLINYEFSRMSRHTSIIHFSDTTVRFIMKKTIET
jgi:hypothetical protein